MELIFLAMFALVVLYRNSQQSLQEELEHEQEEEEVSAILVEVQKYGDQIYFWDRDTGDFIIQGKDMEEIVSKCLKYFPNKYFCIEKEDAEKYNLKVKEATVGE